MNDENDDYVTKSSLTTTFKTLRKYNDRSSVATEQTKKHTQRHRKCQTFRKKNKKIYLKIGTQSDLQ